MDTPEKRSKIRVAVVGCGHKGVFFANAFADVGFRVVCTDADASVVKKMAKGKTSFATLQAEAKLKSHIAEDKIDVISDLKKAVSQSDVVVVAITAKMDEQKKNDAALLTGTCKQIGSALSQGALVIYGGIAPLGFTAGTIKEMLENTSGFKTGQDLGLAYSPILDTDAQMASQELLVGADDDASLEAAANILKTLNPKIQLVNGLKTAEMAALFTVAKHDVATALTNELAMFCENANVDCFKVLSALKLQDHSYRPTINEDKSEGYLLLEAAENVNAKLRLLTVARQVNEDMVKYAVNLTQEALRGAGKTLRRGRVAILGSAANSVTSAIVRLIEQKGAKVSVYDPAAKKDNSDSGEVTSSLNEAIEGADCLIVLSASDQLNHFNLKKLKALMKSPAVLVDLAGKFEPAQVDIEGFIYCGLGRGFEQK